MLWGGRVICGLEYSVEGEESIMDEPSVILIKHATVFETHAQLAVFPPQTWVLKRDVDQQRRPARLNAENMADAVDWLTEFSAFWGTSFDQLDDVLVNLKKTRE